MEHLWKVVNDELQALHFEKAQNTLHNIDLSDNPFQYYLTESRILRGLHQHEKALAKAREAHKAATSSAQKDEALTEEAKALFAQGKMKEASQILKPLASSSDPYIPALVSYAYLLAEKGELQEAQPYLQQLEQAVHSSKITGRLAADVLILLGDTASFAEDSQQAWKWYHQAEQVIHDHFPLPWQKLRMALLWNNEADLQEQEEVFDEALALYEQAWHALESLENCQITDFSSYQLEILFSLASLAGLMERYESGRQWLKRAEEILQSHPPFMQEAFRARLLYLQGLMDLYEDTPASMAKARPKLEKAYQMQKRLLAKGQVKLEHLGKTAYYLASVLEEDQKEWQEQLLQEALSIFQKVQDKEPRFYLSGIPEICNSLGILYLKQDPWQATDFFLKSKAGYTSFLERYPNDTLARESLMFAALNEISSLEEQNAPSKAMRAILALLQQMEAWQDLEDMAPVISFLSSRLLSSYGPWLEEEAKARLTRLEQTAAARNLSA